MQSTQVVRYPGTFINWLIIKDLLITHDDAFYASRNGGEDLVRDGAKDGGEFRDGGVFPEDGDGVPYLAGDAGDVQHAHVHADVADGGGAVAVHAEGGGAAAKVAVNAVRITHGNGGDDSAFGGFAPSAITHRITGA